MVGPTSSTLQEMRISFRDHFFGLLMSFGMIVNAHGQAAPDPLVIKAIAEVEKPATEPGREATQLVSADRVVSGDAVIYTLEVRNSGGATLRRPTVIYAVPAHMSYAADSAVGPGTEVSYSVDSGRSFDAPENLKVQDGGGAARAATAADYTHIRWQLKNPLKANSVAFVRFRARVK